MKEMWDLGLTYQMMLIFFICGAPPALLYPFILGAVKWNESRIGRSMMFKGLALMLVFIQGFLSMYFSSKNWYLWFVVCVTAWLAFAVWYQFTTVIKTIIEGQIEERMKNSKREARNEGPEEFGSDPGKPRRIVG